MVTRIWQWMVYKELLLLARLQNFNHVIPERVIRVLHSFARARALSGKANSAEDFVRAIAYREALLSIWELSRTRYQSDVTQRAKWHLVMASCNSLHEQFSRPGVTEPQAKAA